MKIHLHLLALAGLTLASHTAFAQNTLREVTKCIQRDGHLESIPVHYNTSTGDYTVTVNGMEKPFDDVYPADKTYAANASWYINNESIMVKGKRYIKYGLPRVLSTTEVSKFSVYKGVTIYAEVPRPSTIEVVYIPVRPDCEFQPYQIDPDQPAPPARKRPAGRKRA